MSMGLILAVVNETVLELAEPVVFDCMTQVYSPTSVKVNSSSSISLAVTYGDSSLYVVFEMNLLGSKISPLLTHSTVGVGRPYPIQVAITPL